MNKIQLHPQGMSAHEEDEISLLDLLFVLAKNKVTILTVPFLVAVLAVIYTLTLDNTYTAATKILPPQQSQSSVNAMLYQLGGLASLAGGSLGKSPNDMYLAMLKSHRVMERVVKRFDLQKRYQSKTFEGAIKSLEHALIVSSGKEGLIVVEVDDKDPKFAADIANAFVEELNELLQKFALTEASQKRAFFEQQMRQAKDQLTDAEVRLDKTLNTSLHYMEAVRNLKYYEAIWEILAKQFEGAKLDEAKDFPMIQVLDVALPPEEKSKPKRSLIVMLAILVALFLTIIWVFFREMLNRVASNPDELEKMHRLVLALRWKT